MNEKESTRDKLAVKLINASFVMSEAVDDVMAAKDDNIVELFVCVLTALDAAGDTNDILEQFYADKNANEIADMLELAIKLLRIYRYLTQIEIHLINEIADMAPDDGDNENKRFDGEDKIW